MKTETKPEAYKKQPTPVDLDARYKSIGISAVAAAMRYNSGAPAEIERDRPSDMPTRSAA